MYVIICSCCVGSKCTLELSNDNSSFTSIEDEGFLFPTFIKA